MNCFFQICANIFRLIVLQLTYLHLVSSLPDIVLDSGSTVMNQNDMGPFVLGIHIPFRNANVTIMRDCELF